MEAPLEGRCNQVGGAARAMAVAARAVTVGACLVEAAGEEKEAAAVAAKALLSRRIDVRLANACPTNICAHRALGRRRPRRARHLGLSSGSCERLLGRHS